MTEQRDDAVPAVGDLTVLPPLEADPIFADAVDEAVTGDIAADHVELSPERRLGSARDFSSLYIRHRSSFELHARRFLSDRRDIDEVTQETFLRLFLALPEIETELQAIAFGRRTLTNLCIDRYRAAKRHPYLVDLDAVPWAELEDEFDEADPVLRAEDAVIVRQALSLLTPLHRAALVKREIEEKTLPQIADELGVPEDSVKHLLFRARRALRRLLVGTTVDPCVELSSAEVLSMAHRRLSRAVVDSGQFVLVVIVFVTVGVILATRPAATAPPVIDAGVPGPAATPSTAGMTAPAPTGSTKDPATLRPGTVVPGSHRSRPPAHPPTSAPASHGQVTPPSHVRKPANHPVAKPPAGHTAPGVDAAVPPAAARFRLTGALHVLSPVRVRPVARVLNPVGDTTATSQISAATDAGLFTLTQTVVQSSDASQSVSVQPSLLTSDGMQQLPAVTQSTATVGRSPEGTMTIDVSASTALDPTAAFQMSGVHAHLLLSGDFIHVLAETVTVTGAVSPGPVPSLMTGLPTGASCPQASALLDAPEIAPPLSLVTPVIGMSPKRSDDQAVSCSSTSYGGSTPVLPLPPDGP